MKDHSNCKYFYCDKIPWYKDFKKSSLKTGMVVSTRDNRLSFVALKTEIGDSFFSDGRKNSYYGSFDHYNEDLQCTINGYRVEEYDIDNIYGISSSPDGLYLCIGHSRMLLWNRFWKGNFREYNLTIMKSSP